MKLYLSYEFFSYDRYNDMETRLYSDHLPNFFFFFLQIICQAVCANLINIKDPRKFLNCMWEHFAL